MICMKGNSIFAKYSFMARLTDKLWVLHHSFCMPSQKQDSWCNDTLHQDITQFGKSSSEPQPSKWMLLYTLLAKPPGLTPLLSLTVSPFSNLSQVHSVWNTVLLHALLRHTFMFQCTSRKRIRLQEYYLAVDYVTSHTQLSDAPR